jgi:hypothetical protein
MNKELLNKFIRSFCSDDEIRVNLTKPNYYDNGYIAASDSSSLVLLHAPDFDKTDCFDSKVGIWEVLNPYSKFYEGQVNPIGVIDFSQIKTVLSNITMLPEYKDKYKECSECDGHGTVECSCCCNEADCDECDGDGEVKVGQEETGYYKYPDDECFIIDGCPLGMTAMGKLSDRLSIMDVKELELFETVKKDRIFFRIKGTDIYVLQMGIYHEYIEEKRAKHIIEVIKIN